MLSLKLSANLLAGILEASPEKDDILVQILKDGRQSILTGNRLQPANFPPNWQ